MKKQRDFVKWHETSAKLAVIRRADTVAKSSFSVGGVLKTKGDRRRPVSLPKVRFLEGEK